LGRTIILLLATLQLVRLPSLQNFATTPHNQLYRKGKMSVLRSQPSVSSSLFC